MKFILMFAQKISVILSLMSIKISMVQNFEMFDG